MYFVPEGQHDRSQARSAWDSATPKEPSRRVRYDSCTCAHRFEDWREEISNAVSLSRTEMIPKCIGRVLDHVRHLVILRTRLAVAFLKKHDAQFDEKYLWDSCARSHRTLRDGSFEGRFPRHFVPGYDQPIPPGQKPFRPSKGLALS
jgi:hypothetical protein